MSIQSKIKKLFCEDAQGETFYRFSKEDNGFLANWGSTDKEEYKHLGNMSSFAFNPADNVLRFKTTTDPVVSEALFNRVASPSEKKVHAQLIDSDYADFEDLFLDAVVAKYAKSKGYVGIVFQFANNPGKKYAMDIRNHENNVDTVYNGFMTLDDKFLSSLK